MKLKKLPITQRLDINLLISAANERTQFVAQHMGIASRDDDVRICLRAVASHCAFKLLDVLYFVYQDIVVLASVVTLLYISIEVLIGLDKVELALFLVYVNDIVLTPSRRSRISFIM